jgi:hypothetical protein
MFLGLSTERRTVSARDARELASSFASLDNYAVADDVVSRFWFTYRTGFAPIGK